MNAPGGRVHVLLARFGRATTGEAEPALALAHALSSMAQE